MVSDPSDTTVNTTAPVAGQQLERGVLTAMTGYEATFAKSQQLQMDVRECCVGN